ncbi:MAG: hypothetical protein LBL39_01550 [Planctomycetaceae bacterium]|nr:hypothetical protein [Planctomycetaceae bacterium]
MLLFFFQLFLILIKIHHSPKNKGIRECLGALSATKGNVINKGCHNKVCQLVNSE